MSTVDVRENGAPGPKSPRTPSLGPEVSGFLLEQTQRRLRLRVGLGQDRDARLLQDVVPRQSRGFECNVDVSLSAALSTSLNLNTLDIGSGGNTSLAISAVDDAINSVSGLRGRLGATQNRLNSTINNLAVQVENLSAAESRIRDVDVAFETAQLTRNNILQQSSISILAQANAAPQSALSLLG